jgi:hypothetical protein
MKLLRHSRASFHKPQRTRIQKKCWREVCKEIKEMKAAYVGSNSNNKNGENAPQGKNFLTWMHYSSNS